MGDVLLAVNGQMLENIPVEAVRGMIVGPQVLLGLSLRLLRRSLMHPHMAVWVWSFARC